MSTKKGSPAQHGGRDARDAGTAHGLALQAATACRLADAWVAAAATWLDHGSSPSDIDRARKALREAGRSIGEGLRCCEALHGVDPPKAPPMICEHEWRASAHPATGSEYCVNCGQVRI